METIMRLIESLTPLLVAIVAAYGGVIVAKINKLQKDMKTNHGSTSPGNAIDRIYEKVDAISTDVDTIRKDVTVLKNTDKSLESRLLALENRRRFSFNRRRRAR